MERRVWLSGLAVVLVIFALGYAGWTTFAHATADECYACKRPIHAHSRTVAVMDGHSRLFCCPACALSEHQQAGKPVRITQLTSFLTSKPLAPDSAFVVKGSEVNMCERTKELITADKRPADLHYDRCAPSLIGFAEKNDAVQFARQHGGEVMAFHEAAAGFAK